MRRVRLAFTLIELLVVVAIISLLIAILLPTLSGARRQARSAKCLANLRSIGQGICIYGVENRDVLPAGRLPKISGDDCNPYADIAGGRKYRPTFAAIVSSAVGAAPFVDPQPCKGVLDFAGEPSDQQNYGYGVYVCGEAATWTDERNASYGYNYQFLGNSRTPTGAGPTDYKNWPVRITDVRHAGRVVMVGDSLGTAASFKPEERLEYDDDGRTLAGLGNEGFNLDPPRVDAAAGEMAGFDDNPQVRTAVDQRHGQLANVLWVDGHAEGRTAVQLGYRMDPAGRVTFDGDNSSWVPDGVDRAWLP